MGRPSEDRHLGWARPILWYLAIAGLVCFFRLGATGAIHNEGIVFDGARYMQRTGEMLVPHLYNEVYTYKPPLTYWLAYASFELTGHANVWTLRLPLTLTAFVMGLVILALIGKAVHPRTGSVCAVAAMTTCLMLEKLRIGEHDLPLAAGVGVAVVAACVNLTRPRPRTVLWLLCYLALTFAFLAKGVPAMMAFFPGLIAAALLGGSQRRLLAAGHLGPLALFGLSVVGYVWLARAAVGPAAFAQPLLEAKVRGFDWGLRMIGETAVKPLVAVAALLPWSALFPLALPGLRGAAGSSPARGIALAAAAFSVAGVMAFVLVPTYEVRYFLPLTTAVGVVGGLVAVGELELTEKRVSTARRLALVLALVFAAAAIGIGAWNFALPNGVALFVLGLAAVGLILTARRSGATARHMTIAALCAWLTLVLVIAPQRAEKRSLEPVAEIFAPEVPAGSWLWLPHQVGDELSSLLFYLDRPVATFGHDDARPLPGALAIVPRELTDSLEADEGLHWAEVAGGRQAGCDVVLARLEIAGCPGGPSPASFETRVDDLHRGLLERSPSASERTELAALLQAGMPAAELGRLLLRTQPGKPAPGGSEREVASRLYRELLGRKPDRRGLEATSSDLRWGGLRRRAAAMLTSAEYVRKNPYCSRVPS